MAKRILILDGHPDPSPMHFCHALAHAYAGGAHDAGHEVRRINVGELDFPILRTMDDWSRAPPPPAIAKAQEDMLWAEHIVIIFPLWLGNLPALLKGFFEQTFRPGFAFSRIEEGKAVGQSLLPGRSVRLIVTMGMPACLFRWYFCAHSIRSLKRNILGYCGLNPIHDTLIGSMALVDGNTRQRELEKTRALGYQGD